MNAPGAAASPAKCRSPACQCSHVLLLGAQRAPHQAALPARADISELDLPKNVSIRFPEGKDKIMNFEIILKPEEGMYKWVVLAGRSCQGTNGALQCLRVRFCSALLYWVARVQQEAAAAGRQAGSLLAGLTARLVVAHSLCVECCAASRRLVPCSVGAGAAPSCSHSQCRLPTLTTHPRSSA